MADRDSATPPVPPPSPPAPRPATPRKSPRDRALALWQKIVHDVSARFPVKFAALSLALSLWILVSAQEQTEGWVGVNVQLITDSTVSLAGEVPVVQALVAGRFRELLKLDASPPEIRRVVSADTPDQVTLDLRPGDVIIPGNADVRVRDVTPRAITLDFNVTEQRYLPVRPLARITADSTMRVTSGPRVLPGSVLVRGPRRAVRALASITTRQLNIFIRENVTVRTVELDTSGLELTAVTPPEVRVRVTAERIATPAPPPVTTPALLAPAGIPESATRRP